MDVHVSLCSTLSIDNGRALPAGILPSDPAQLAKARLWGDLWGSYVGPAQVG